MEMGECQPCPMRKHDKTRGANGDTIKQGYFLWAGGLGSGGALNFFVLGY